MITLVLGGARSGKSEVAERRAATLAPPVTYLATGQAAGDADWEARLQAHRARRPSTWVTVEAGAGLVAALAAVDGSVLIDALGTWVAATWRATPSADERSGDFAADVDGLVAALRRHRGDVVVVSDEVGLGVVPSTALGGRFRDLLGRCNRAVADVADEVLLVVAGRILPLERA